MIFVDLAKMHGQLPAAKASGLVIPVSPTSLRGSAGVTFHAAWVGLLLALLRIQAALVVEHD